jgi:hypothetical protein
MFLSPNLDKCDIDGQGNPEVCPYRIFFRSGKEAAIVLKHPFLEHLLPAGRNQRE